MTGRIGRTKRVVLSDVKRVEKRPFAFRLGYYALLEMTDGSVVSVQPDNVDSFLSALEKRIEKKDNKGMRLKYLSALVVGVVLSLPTQAQVLFG